MANMRGTGRIGQKTSQAMHDAIAQKMGWRDHKDALAHRDAQGHVGRNPNQLEKALIIYGLLKERIVVGKDVPVASGDHPSNFPTLVGKPIMQYEKDRAFQRWKENTTPRETARDKKRLREFRDQGRAERYALNHPKKG